MSIELSEFFTAPKLLILGGIIYSVVLHEAAHAFAADRLGDPTPRMLGKVTLNPVPIIQTSPFMTLLLPIITWFSFGGKFALGGGETPVDGAYFRMRPKADLLMSLVGPLTNFTLCVVLSIALVIPNVAPPNSPVFDVISTLAWTNLILAMFNMLPIPPLDCSHILGALVPGLRSLYDMVSGFGFLLIVFIGWPLFRYIAGPMAETYSKILRPAYESIYGPGSWPWT